MRIFVSVAEASADQHAAALVRTARRELPEAVFRGLTGPELRRLGVETVCDLASHAAMLTGAVGLVGRAWSALRRVERDWQRHRPDLLLVLDSPEFHLPLARRARRLGIPVLYYIAPQTWASRPGRNRRIARDVDHLACILPFEEQYFRDVGVTATFVGHPLFETLAGQRPDADRVAAWRRDDRPVVALLPGSRRHVVAGVLPLQLRIMSEAARLGFDCRLLISAASHEREQQIRTCLAGSEQPAEVVCGDNASLISAADVVLVASGTATLHAAHYRKPMIVVYDAGRLANAAYALAGRLVIKTPHFSLVNILAQARVVPEFVPQVRDPAAVARLLVQLLNDAGWRRLMVSQIDQTVRPLERTRASPNVCRIIRRLLGQAGPQAGQRQPRA